MSAFPKTTFVDLYNSSFNLNKRFRSTWPSVDEALAIYVEEVNEVMDAMDEEDIRHLSEEIVDVIVTAMGGLMVHQTKIDIVWSTLAHSWNARDDLRLSLFLKPNVEHRIETLQEFITFDRAFRRAMTSGTTPFLRVSFTELVVSAVALVIARGGSLQDITGAMAQVIAKNNAKTEKTHFLDKQTNKITRRSR